MSQEPYYRDTWAEINLSNIDFNIKQLRKHLKEETGIYAVVKANGYGHGDIQVAEQALESGADRLAVSLLDEAIKLRRAGMTCPILVMGWIRPEDAVVASEYDVAITVFQKEWFEQVETEKLKNPLNIHMKWDTGMGRIGIRTTEEMDAILNEIKKHPFFKLDAIFTHFATADEEDTSYYEEQERRLEELVNHLQKVWPEDVDIHSGNSAASMRFPDRMKQFIRFGISMYGLYPSGDVKKERPIELQPAFSLNSRLIHVKKVGPGESLSYGATYTTSETEWIGTVPVGYADGWIRKLQGFEVLVDGKRHPIVGRICMDQFMIRLDQEYSLGSKVTLIGKQNQEEVHMDDVAEHLETINYEIPCTISYRVPRMYIKHGHIVEVENSL
ncbi:alanine racemase 1 [Halobacillus andaensis]|uniref:Alanine racemase n=1 Tax=Halobacillus andaensis TaxID=1176239 RepID=A0A917EZA9_HALAA|nr:alanine racemase [Halobacillus andaensis]MBP2006194.1 alanine racemase [Halobacillus andaensis]GGF33185.1 alanine racemase 1 [Halobacillus andaensis]